jgi:hypothetical protein
MFDSLVKELPTALPTLAALSLPPPIGFPTFFANGLKTFFLDPPNRLFFPSPPVAVSAVLSGLDALFSSRGSSARLLKFPVF